jgi:hypothetical protein
MISGKNAIPNLADWMTPAASTQELDKRIADLKAVLFWLEQNATILRATVQALQVQKMTLTALGGMNLNLADVAKAFTAPAQSAAETAPQPAAGDAPEADAAKPAPAAAAADPLQWWGALTRQFQTLAAHAAPPAVSVDPAAPAAKRARKSVNRPAVKKQAAPKKPARSAVRRGGA